MIERFEYTSSSLGKEVDPNLCDIVDKPAEAFQQVIWISYLDPWRYPSVSHAVTEHLMSRSGDSW